MEEKKQKKHYRIGLLGIVILLSSSIVVDLITLIPVAGDILGWSYFMVISIYLWQTGHGLVNWKLYIVELISVVAEMVPGIQELPTIFAAVLAIIILSRLEDTTGMSLMPVAKIGIRTPKSPKNPVNSRKNFRAPNKRPVQTQQKQEDFPLDMGEIA